MRKKTLLSFNVLAVLMLLLACETPSIEKPDWVNATEVVNIPLQKLEFWSNAQEWNASLLSFVQPIPLTIQYKKSGFTISQQNDLGVIDGPAQICLSSGNQYFYYAVILKNSKQDDLNERDYRSPKTVNTDSTLQHQQMMHSIDQWRNIVKSDLSASYFFEKELSLPSKVGTFRAQSEKALSAYYIQAGSCVEISLKAKYMKEENAFYVTAGPLEDKYGNTVADGTIVVFTYSDGLYTNRMEVPLINGFALTKIPVEEQKKLTLFARVDRVFSNKIQLNP